MTRDGFIRTFAAVLASALYLPSAQCFALVPILSSSRRSHSGSCSVDYDTESGNVLCLTGSPLVSGCSRCLAEVGPAHRCCISQARGAEVVLSDPRSNAEMLLTYGLVEDGNPNDFLEYETSLIGADRLYSLKRQVRQRGCCWHGGTPATSPPSPRPGRCWSRRAFPSGRPSLCTRTGCPISCLPTCA